MIENDTQETTLSARESGIQPRVKRALRVSLWHFAIAFVVAATLVAIQKYAAYAVNNYLVFTGSLKVLLSHQSLYVPHPEYYGDLYKYSPTFPLVMAPLAWMPLPVGLICWNIVNALSLYAVLTRLWPDQRRVLLTLSLIATELVVSMQHFQSNALVAALIVLVFVELERAQSWKAGLAIAAGFFLKGYGAAAGILALLYPTRVRTIGATIAWSVVLALAPLVVLSSGELLGQYQQWLGVGGTFTVMRNMSVMRVAAQYIGPGLNPTVVQAAGGVLFLLPFARIGAWSDARFRIRALCSLLIALVIFNNSAEPPTYIIAMTGCAIWYASEPDRSPLDRRLTVALLLVIMLISTDLYPRALREFAGPWTVKTMGSLLVWLRINFELFTIHPPSPSTFALRATADKSA